MSELKVTISLGEKKLDLSVEEAKELYGQLDALYGKRPAFIPPYIPYVIPYNPPYRYYWAGGSITATNTIGAAPGGMTASQAAQYGL